MHASASRSPRLLVPRHLCNSPLPPNSSFPLAEMVASAMKVKPGATTGVKKDVKKDEKKGEKQVTVTTVALQNSGDALVQAMDAGLLKRFNSHMKYHGDVKGDPDARNILQAFDAGTPEEKRALLAKFSKNGKDLKWSRDMKSSTTNTTGTSRGFVEDWYNRTLY